MGVAVVVSSLLGDWDIDHGMTMLGVGLACIGIYLQKEGLNSKPRGNALPGGILFFADAPLGGNGEEGIPQLCQCHTQYIQFIVCKCFRQHVGGCRDGDSQLTGVHCITFPAILCCPGAFVRCPVPVAE